MTERTYARVYHEIVDDPRFERVYGNDAALGCWLRMLLVADATYPHSAPMPHRNPTVRLLIEAGLIEERPGNRYVVHGLEAERERRSEIGRNAVAVRWNNERNTNVIPAKQSKAEHNKADSANAPGTFMGYRPRVKADADDVKRQADEDWVKCADCDLLKRKHPVSGDHPFRPELRSVS